MIRCSLCLKKKPRYEFDPKEYQHGGVCNECSKGSRMYNVVLTVFGGVVVIGILYLAMEIYRHAS